MARNAAASYILCASPRSGTTLLCGMLAQTNVAGQPDSFFRAQSHAEWARDFGLTPQLTDPSPAYARAFVQAICAEGRGATDTFGMRLMGESLEFSQKLLTLCAPDAPSDAARFTAAFGSPRYIHLSRQNRLAQAVSWVRAAQSGLWHRNADGTVLEQNEPQLPPGFDRGQIDAALAHITQMEAIWQGWFAAQGITPLTLTYEALAKDPRATLQAVLHHIGQDPAAALQVTPGVAKLGDATSQDWMARYKAATG